MDKIVISEMEEDTLTMTTEMPLEYEVGEVETRVSGSADPGYVADQAQLDSCWCNLVKNLGQQSLVTCIAYIEANEVYGCTLRDSLKTLLVNDGIGWWVDTPHGFKMGRLMQYVFKEMILGLAAIAKQRINFVPTLDSVVFDCKESSPKLRFLSVLGDTDSRDQFNSQNMWSGLAKSIEEMMELLNISVNNEVNNFLESLKTDGERLVVALRNPNYPQKKRFHLALLNREEMLHFIEDIRNLFHEGKIFHIFVNDASKVSHDWRNKVCIDHYLKVVRNTTNTEQETSPSRSDPKGLIYFIRDCVHHVNDCSNLSQHNGHKITMDELDKKLDKLFPTDTEQETSPSRSDPKGLI